MTIKFKSPWWQLLKPKHILWLPIFLILRFCAMLPYRWQYALGIQLGHLLIKIDRKGLHTVNVNMTLAFPELTPDQRILFSRENYESVGLSLIETATAWFNHQQRFQRLLSVEGGEFFESARASGRGIILASAHLGCLEMAGQLFSARYPVSVMYRPQKLAILDIFARYYRAQCYQQIIARDDLRGLIRTLKSGGIVWYTPDIDAGRRNSVFAPFFGIPTATLTTTSRLAARTDAIVLPTFFYRNANGQGYRVVFKAPLENFPSGNDEIDAIHLNAAIEQAVRIAPTQYLWQYKRFKTRPAGEKRFY